MSLTIYNKFEFDKFQFANETNYDSSKIISYKIFDSNSSFSTTYGDWNNVHSILFESYDGDKNTFRRDDVGFIPPHILSKIINSNHFKSKYNEIKNDLDEQIEVETNFKSQNEGEENWDAPDYYVMKISERDLEILDFVISLVNVGIYYS